MTKLLSIAVLITAVLIAGNWLKSNHGLWFDHEDSGALDEAGTEDPASTFECDGRIYYSQMASCAEATWFLQHCPGTKMDGNGDDVPCEAQWCGTGNDRGWRRRRH